MYSLMLVEDEPVVLDGMMKIIDFESLGFKLVSACANGLEALEAYKQYKPDVVVTDICMDIMDGLEFIEEVSREHSHTKFVIVSGHQDFKFFKRALSLKVTDYILKPVTAREFRELLRRISDELAELQGEDNHADVNQFREFMEVERNMFFNRFMHVKMDEDEVSSKLSSFGIEFTEPLLQTAVFRIDQLGLTASAKGLKSADELLNVMYHDICTIINDEEKTLAFISTQGYVIVIVNSDKSDTNKRILNRILGSVRERYMVGDSGRVDCYVGFEVDSIFMLPKSFRSANRLNICGVLDNGKGYYDSETLLFRRAHTKPEYTEEMKAWVKLIIFSDPKSSIVLESVFRIIYEAGCLLTDFQIAIGTMQEYLISELQLLKHDVDMQFITDIEQKNEKALKRELRQITESLVVQIGENSAGKDSYIAQKAVDFIEANYTDANIDLTQICTELNVSVSYFSTVFKKYTSMTFVKYLNNYRVERAKYFLEYSQASIGEISEMVGFVESHYFGIVFKKYTMTTPKKYRAGLQ